MSSAGATNIEALKVAAGPDLAALAEEAGFRHVRGKTWRCAFHRDQHPSVHEYPEWLYCFACSRSFDVIELGSLIYGEMRAGIKALAQRYGIASGKPTRNINVATLENAERFIVGFRWALERHLADLKAVLMSQEEAEPKLAESVLRYTRLLADLDESGARDVVWFYSQMRKCKSHFVSSCIQETREFDGALTAALHGGAA